MARKKAAAKKKTRKKISKKKSADGEPITVQVSISSSDDDPFLYVNFAEVTQSKFEFMLSFARIPTRPSQSQLLKVQDSETLLLTPEIQVIFPPKLVQPLINALQKQLEKHEGDHGKVE